MTGGSSSSSESEEVEGRFACALEPGGAAGTGVGWTVAMITPYVSDTMSLYVVKCLSSSSEETFRSNRCDVCFGSLWKRERHK
jgi:hypothetical protein